MKLTKQQIETRLLTHKHGGNGWGVLVDHDSEWCQVVGALKRVGSVVLLVSKSMVEVGPEIEPKVLEELNTLRAQIRSGTHVVKNNHVVPV